LSAAKPAVAVLYVSSGCSQYRPLGPMKQKKIMKIGHENEKETKKKGFVQQW
jgi:hypothetical protein